MRLLTATALAVLLAFPVMSSEPFCMEAEKSLGSIGETGGLAAVEGLTGLGNIFQVIKFPDASWLAIYVSPQGQMCVLSAGTHFETPIQGDDT